MIVRDVLYREGMEVIRAKAADLDVPVPHNCDLDNGEPMSCLAGKSQFWITWNGAMTPCGMLPGPTVHPFEDGFATAWEQLRALCDPIRLCPECVDCPEQRSCMNCAAVTFAETGRFDGKPEYMCRLNKAYRETILKMAKTE